MGLEASGDTDTKGSAPSYIGPQGLINRNEYLRLLQQTLAQLGFSDVAQQLEERSGVPRQSLTTFILTECILNGDWTGALDAVRSLDLVSKIAAHISFLILEQKFSELLATGDQLAAIKCLRNDLAPLNVNTERLHELSRKLLAASSGGGAAIRKHALTSPSSSSLTAGSIGKTAAGRRKLLVSLQNNGLAGALLPENRLEELVEQALFAQIDTCRLHNTPNPHVSLLRNYSCGLEQLPLICSQILEAHTSEVWHLQFSHNGKMLATCGRDNKVILWEIVEEERKNGGGYSGNEIGGNSPLPLNNTNTSKQGQQHPSSGSSTPPQARLHRIFSGHTAPVLFVAWSHDDSILASCGQDSHVRLWSPTTSSCIKVLRHHSDPVLSASWLPDNKTLVTAGQDRMVAVVGIGGEVIQNWTAHRMQDVLVTAGGRYIFASTHDRRINVYEALVRPKAISNKEQEDGMEMERGEENKNDSLENQRRRVEILKRELEKDATNSTDDTNNSNEWLFSALFDSRKQRDSTLLEGEDLMAFSTSACGRYLLANLRDGTLSLWDLGSRCHRTTTLKLPVGLVSRFSPPGNPEGTLGRFVVRSCIGGVGAKFITTGTESGKVPIWQRDTGELLAVLEGHSGVVNAVAWNEKRPEMMASASDDGTIRIWKSESSSGSGSR
jgi:WD40 repeat protein